MTNWNNDRKQFATSKSNWITFCQRAEKVLKSTTFHALVYRILCCLTILGACLILWFPLHFSDHGFDFTDEGYYLNSIASPSIYDSTVTQFGFIYHPLHLVSDLVLLRQLNILITFIATWILAHSVFEKLSSNIVYSKVETLIVSASTATSGLLFFSIWVPSPSYNSLAFQALLLTSAGLMRAEKTKTPKSILGYFTVGIGTWLAFMAKPTTAFLLVVIMLLYVILAKKNLKYFMFLSGITSFVALWASAVYIDGGIIKFVSRLLRAIYFAGSLGAGHTVSNIFRIDNLVLKFADQRDMLVLFSGIIVAVIFATSPKKKFKCIYLLIGLICFFCTYSHLFLLSKFHYRESLPSGLIICGIVFAQMSMGIVFALQKQRYEALDKSMAFLFLAMPMIFAFGTNNNYWEQGRLAIVFWIFAGFAMMGAFSHESNLFKITTQTVILAAQAVTAILFFKAIEHPYGQPSPLYANRDRITLGRAQIYLHSNYSLYHRSIMDASRDGGFSAMTPLIDLTGISPGLSYVLGAESMGAAWLIGGYPGSKDFAIATLSRMQCSKLAKAWLILEPNGPISLTSDILFYFGINFPLDFQKVGEWQTAGTEDFGKIRVQEMYKPIRPEKILKNCSVALK